MRITYAVYADRQWATFHALDQSNAWDYADDVGYCLDAPDDAYRYGGGIIWLRDHIPSEW